MALSEGTCGGYPGGGCYYRDSMGLNRVTYVVHCVEPGIVSLKRLEKRSLIFYSRRGEKDNREVKWPICHCPVTEVGLTDYTGL